MRHDDVIIAAARRTPIGSFLGALSPLSAIELAAAVIRELINDSNIAPERVSEVLMGCILPAGLGQAPARQAALNAGIPQSVPCTTINKMCGSAMKTVMLGHDQIKAGSADVIIAGGMESMSNAPHLLSNTRRGKKMGEWVLIDHMLYDGLQDPYSGAHMGEFAERCAERFGFNRKEQDAYASRSVSRSLTAIENNAFASEITPITVRRGKEEVIIDQDEQPGRCDLSKISQMQPVFRPENGTVTAANSSSISDGAAALLLSQAGRAGELGLTVMGRILGHVTYARIPEEFTIAPIDAIKRLYEKLSWTDADVDLYEINEAFAVVAMAAIKELGLDPKKVNVNGGACALGHPIGSTGARIIVTLIHALRQRNLKRGIACLCIGGGEATAIALELL